jgi:hypothetical protein
MKWTAQAEEWKRVLEEYESEGVKRREFCSVRGIKVTTFDYWRARLRKTAGNESGVVKVTEVVPVLSAIRIRVDERITIELDGSADESQLVRVLRAVGEA